ncbi:MAG: DUF3604 domain-containing protein, partial [Acidobacteria bacterium]|nr:DUF3604 domain-containing protein [Acidobacteriota bacterium]
AAVAALLWTRPGPVPRLAGAPVAAPASSGFMITFGLKAKTHGRAWSGGVRDPAQVRSIQGWHLGEGDSIVPPDRWNITLASVGGDVAAKAVILDLVSPEDQLVTIFARVGDFSFVPAEIQPGKPYLPEQFRGDVSIQRVPLPQVATGREFEDDDPAILRTRNGEYWLAWVAYKTLRRDGYQVTGGDQIMVARGRDGWRWFEKIPLTQPGDHFRVALGEDGRGRIWCIYGAQKKPETGNFDLYAKVFDGDNWSAEQRLTNSPLPDVFHRVASDRDGNLYLVWMGFRPGPSGGPAQSEILMRVLSGDRWGDEINLSQSAENEWEPAVATDHSGSAWIAWDSYRVSGAGPATYDLMLRSYSQGKPGPVETVSATPYAEMRADVAVDAQDRVWVAWEEGGLNWGKDTGYENPKHRIFLRPGGSRIYGPPGAAKTPFRRPRIAILDGGQWKQPKARLEASISDSMQPNLFLSPRLGVDGHGSVWLFLRNQLINQGRNGGQMFDYYATSLTGSGEWQRWAAPVLLPGSTARQDTVLATAPAGAGIAVAVVGDGRHFPVPLPVNHDISTLLLNAPLPQPELTSWAPSQASESPVTHPGENAQIAAVREHRLSVAGRGYKIVRGDVHRHTEICMDGGLDGSLWDLYRYAIDAAGLDYVAVTDHNYGAWLDTDEPESPNTDNEYQWWRTQKSADIFYVPGRFVPLYGYERSINFPLGHRNILHVRRGVFSYRVPKLHISERPELIEKDAQGLWSYLRLTDGLAIPHTTATSMGTDWRLRDDELEPVAEIYQGDRNSYEDQGQPRAALKDAPGDGGAGRAPFQKGLIWNALGVGYKMGFIASSDHWSTHISYANLLVPDRPTTRGDILDAFRQRRTYGSTDNIVLDFHAGDVLQGGEVQAAQSPTFYVHARGTESILRAEIVKNNRVIYTRPAETGAGDGRRIEFSFRDNDTFGDTSMAPTSEVRDWDRPETGMRPRTGKKMAYYYVRVIQRYSAAEPAREGEIAWSSPIFVNQ